MGKRPLPPLLPLIVPKVESDSDGPYDVDPLYSHELSEKEQELDSQQLFAKLEPDLGLGSDVDPDYSHLVLVDQVKDNPQLIEPKVEPDYDLEYDGNPRLPHKDQIMDNSRLVPKAEPDTNLETSGNPEYSHGLSRKTQKAKRNNKKSRGKCKKLKTKEMETPRSQPDSQLKPDGDPTNLTVLSPQGAATKLLSFEVLLQRTQEYCPICNKQLKVRMELKEHLTSHFTSAESKNSPRCPICSQEFNRLAKLFAHIDIVHKSTIKRPDDDDEMEATDKIQAKKPQLCEICGRSFKTSLGFQKHIVVHAYAEEEPELKLCNKCGVKVKNLKQHRQDCVKKEFACSACPRSYDSKITLTSHFFQYHAKDPLKSQCPLCKKMLSCPLSMKTHLNMKHSTEKPFACTVCDKKFKSAMGLKYHLKVTHSKDKPFTCTICGKKLKTLQGLDYHVKCHARKERSEINESASEKKNNAEVQANSQINSPIKLRKGTSACDSSDSSE